jgi:formiminoglutamate deiminase
MYAHIQSMGIAVEIIHASRALTPEGWAEGLTLAIDQSRIRLLDGPPPPEARRVDLLLPAPVNLHSHAFQRAMAGLTEARGPDPTDSFWTWRRLMYRFLDRLTPDQIETIAAMVFMEMLEAGYGAVVEFHYLHHDVGGRPYAQRAETAARIAAAAERTGIGLTLLPVLYMQGGCDGRALAGGQRRFGCDLGLYAVLVEDSAAIIAGGPSDYALGVAPHSLRAVTPDALAEVQTLAPERPIHMHLAEQAGEVEEVQAHLGARPVTWLLDHAPVDERWCLIHCTQTTPAETGALAASGAVVGLCPITESSLGDGIFDAVRFAGALGRFGVGSDSNIHVALWQELATLEYSQRLRDRSRAALATAGRSTGRVLFDAVTAAGAQAASRESGAIAEGRLADLIAIETENAVLAGRAGDTLLDSLIVSGRGAACISDVWSAGRHVVTQGRHVTREAITRDYVGVMRALRDAL